MEYLYSGGKNKLAVYSRGKREVIKAPFDPYCYIRGNGNMVDARTGVKLKKLEFNSVGEMSGYVYYKGDATYEGDVRFENRVMMDMDWKISDVPKCWLDIETSSKNTIPLAERDPIIAIGMMFDDGREVFLSTVGKPEYTEKMMLDDCVRLLSDVGILMTFNGGEDVWETRSFDLPYMAMRYGLAHGMDVKSARFKLDERLRHCAFLDIYQTYKGELSSVGKSLVGGFGLDNICRHEFGVGKVERTKSFEKMSYEEMKEYNMKDVELLKRLDQKYGFSDAEIDLANMTNLRLTDWRKNKKRATLNTTSIADNMIIKFSKEQGIVWNNIEYEEYEKTITGALVLTPKVGRFVGVQNYDVKQMYPSIIVNERISPDKDRKIIPEIILKLKAVRAKLKAEYKRTGKTEDYIRQYNCKVLANSIYGMLGQGFNRYKDQELAAQVTAKGREILQKFSRVCEDNGLEVLYGDTDSNFVRIEKDKVKAFERVINREIAPYEIEAGEWYDSILFIGSESGGTKKRYAGMVDGALKVVGLEAIRRDYCDLARKEQKWALAAILGGEKLSKVKQHLVDLYEEMKTGKYDKDLILTKGVRLLEQYSTERKYPPHVRALEKLIKRGYGQPFDIQYVFVKQDEVEPVINGEMPDGIDYLRYYERQVKAVVQSLLKSIEVQNKYAGNLMRFMSS